jgi:hypothetical protein
LPIASKYGSNNTMDRRQPSPPLRKREKREAAAMMRQ